MTRPRKLHTFGPPRRRLGSSAEVGIGAYARRQLRRRILIGVFGALLITGAFALYRQLRPRGQAGGGERYPARVRCVSCGYTTTWQVRPAHTFPTECPQCGEVTCQELWRCLDCGAEFVPEQTGTLLRCPECNSERVGSAAVP